MSIWTRFNGLRFQIVLLLTLALLPLGAIAVYQTNRVEAEARRSAQLSVLALTGRAAKAEELIIEGAFGAARFLATIAPDLLRNPDACGPQLSRFIADNPVYASVDIVPLSGRTTCNSMGVARDFAGVESFDAAIAAQAPTAKIDEEAPSSNRSVFSVFQPFDVGGTFGGVIVLTIPHTGMPDVPDRIENLGLTELATFNGNGVFLTARGGLEQAEQERPANRNMTEFVVETATVFEARNQFGKPRIYTFVPIEGSPVTVMGVWRAEHGVGDQIGSQIYAALFPMLMWAASMAVAMLSIHRLVLRHISSLSTSMDTFAENRKTEETDNLPTMPNELVELTDNFSQMTDDILHDEAKLQDALHEKNVLIKEVHHRVKNNLQLISSIMNMQIRAAKHDETRAVLSSLQDRVLSLATIHRDLYQTQNNGMVDARDLIIEIVDKTVDVAFPAQTKIIGDVKVDRIWLYPDQAVPLSLLVAEGMTNMMKHLGAPLTGLPWYKVALENSGSDCTVTLANSVGDTLQHVESTGLGAQLINAFAIQLGGTIDQAETEDAFTFTVRFKIDEFVPDTRDY